jgi:hypothetical protein
MTGYIFNIHGSLHDQEEVLEEVVSTFCFIHLACDRWYPSESGVGRKDLLRSCSAQLQHSAVSWGNGRLCMFRL